MKSFVAQMKSLKMDILALESRFNGEMVSQIACLRSNQNHLESCIRKQDEVIRKLTDDNRFQYQGYGPVKHLFAECLKIYSD